MRGRTEESILGSNESGTAARGARDSRLQQRYGSTTQLDSLRSATWEEMEMGHMNAASIAHEHRGSFLLLLLMLGMLAFSVLTSSSAHGIIQQPIQNKGRGGDTGSEGTKNKHGEQREQPPLRRAKMQPKEGGRWTDFIPLPSPGTTITIPPGINISSSGASYEIAKPTDEGSEEFRQWNFRDGLNISMWEMGRGLQRSCLSCVHSECAMANELVNKTESSSPPCVYFCESESMVKSSTNGLALSMAMEATGKGVDMNPCATQKGVYMAGSIQSRWTFKTGQISIEMRMKEGGPKNAETCLRILGAEAHSTEINICILPMWGYNQATLYSRDETGRKSLKFVPLNFKASEAFHTYAIRVVEGSVQWIVDGNALHSQRIAIAQNTMFTKISYQPDAIHPSSKDYGEGMLEIIKISYQE